MRASWVRDLKRKGERQSGVGASLGLRRLMSDRETETISDLSLVNNREFM